MQEKMQKMTKKGRLTAVDAHLRVDESDHMLLVVQVVVGPDPVQGRPDHLGKVVLIVLFN